MGNSHPQKDQKLVFKINYRLILVKSTAECSKGSILQYFWPSLIYHLSLRSLFWPFYTGFTAFLHTRENRLKVKMLWLILRDMFSSLPRTGSTQENISTWLKNCWLGRKTSIKTNTHQHSSKDYYCIKLAPVLKIIFHQCVISYTCS